MAIGNPAVGRRNGTVAPAIDEARSRAQISGSRPGNLVLAALADSEYELLQPHLEFVALPQYFILHEQAESIPYAYFPASGMVSLVVVADDGRSVEVGLVGREGIVGTPLSVGLGQGPYRAISQIPGNAARVACDVLRDLLPALPELQLSFGRYVLMQGMQMAQIAACNRLHELDQRLARWLLMCQDRVDCNILPLTHEFLAQMLGTGRPSVSLAIGNLEQDKFIENLRGTVRILDRHGLEKTACECYAVVRDFNRELGLS